MSGHTYVNGRHALSARYVNIQSQSSSHVYAPSVAPPLAPRAPSTYTSGEAYVTLSKAPCVMPRVAALKGTSPTEHTINSIRSSSSPSSSSNNGSFSPSLPSTSTSERTKADADAKPWSFRSRASSLSGKAAASIAHSDNDSSDDDDGLETTTEDTSKVALLMTKKDSQNEQLQKRTSSIRSNVDKGKSLAKANKRTSTSSTGSVRSTKSDTSSVGNDAGEQSGRSTGSCDSMSSGSMSSFAAATSSDKTAGVPQCRRPSREHVKITVLGPGGAGKSALIMQQIARTFHEDYDPTIEDLYVMQTEIDNRTCVMDVLDTCGQKEYHSLLSEQHIAFGDVIMLVFDLSDWGSWEEMREQWFVSVREKCPKKRIVLVANKTDVSSSNAVPSYLIDEFVSQNKLPFFATSAKFRHNVPDAFEECVREHRHRIEEETVAAEKAATLKSRKKASFFGRITKKIKKERI